MRKKWEYRIEMAVAIAMSFNMDFNKQINELGEEGWEAAGVFYDAKKSLTYILFKREK